VSLLDDLDLGNSHQGASGPDGRRHVSKIVLALSLVLVAALLAAYWVHRVNQTQSRVAPPPSPTTPSTTPPREALGTGGPAAPLPPLVQALRVELYGRLAPVANRWAGRLSGRARRRAAPPYPPTLAAFLARCHASGQRRPTPLLLSYAPGGYNCLHQDIYGDVAFPLQVVIALSDRGRYTGGEFLLVEQRPRAQSRGHAIPIDQGCAVAFATRERPVAGARGDYRVALRHGVSTVTDGARMTLGLIFHDAT